MIDIHYGDGWGEWGGEERVNVPIYESDTLFNITFY